MHHPLEKEVGEQGPNITIHYNWLRSLMFLIIHEIFIISGVLHHENNLVKMQIPTQAGRT